MADVNYLDWASLTLVVVGALNWGLVGLGQFAEGSRNAFNLVYQIGQAAGMWELEAVVYLLVGLSGLYQVYFGYQLYQGNENSGME